MIPAPPDPVLREHLARALDGDAVAELLRPRLPDVDIRECAPVYARWKPGTSCVVQYRMVLATAGREARDTTVHARLYADGRALHQAARPSLARLADRAARRAREAPAVRALALSELGALVQVFPVDRDLRPLARIASPRSVRRLLGLRADPTLTLLRYKPGRKALFRVEECEAGVLYAKVYAEAARLRVALARAIADAGAPTPRPDVFVASQSLAVQRAAHGTRLAGLEGPTRREGLRAAAEALVRLQSVPPPTYVPPDDAPNRLRRAVGAAAALVPKLEARIVELGTEIAARIAPAGDAVLLHGDFYDDQVLVDGPDATLLDLDEARLGHGLHDVGTMAAHLSVARDDGGRAAFLDAAGASPRDVAAFEASALMQLATGPFRRLQPDWPTEVERIVELARERVASPSRCIRPEPTAPVAPGPATVEAELRALVGTPVEVRRADVVREKPGRRATTRYAIVVRGRAAFLYGKAYASGRAPSVFDTHRRLYAARERIRAELPAPVACLPERRLVLLGAVGGEPASPRLGSADTRVAWALAETLRRVHLSGVALTRTHMLEHELAPIAERVAELARRRPRHARSLRRCLDLVTAGSRVPWRWRSLPILRDVYEDHVRVLPDGRLGLFDLDDAAMSEPAVDVANVTAHLRLLALRSPETRGAAWSAQAFRTRYAQLDEELDATLVRFLVGTTMLRLAAIHGVRDGGAELAPRLLALAERALRHDSLVDAIGGATASR